MRKALVLLVVWMCAAPSFGEQSTREKAVWKLEHAFCKDHLSGDTAGLLSLLDPDFLGWQAGSPVPRGKDYFVQGIKDRASKGIRMESCEIEPLASQVTKNVVVVYYRMTTVSADKDGPATQSYYRITHTWIRNQKDRWQIFGGMGVALADTK